jgi:hypothetical protein
MARFGEASDRCVGLGGCTCPAWYRSQLVGAMQGSVQCPTCDDEWVCSPFDHRSNGVRVGTQVLITNSPGYHPAVSGFKLES